MIKFFRIPFALTGDKTPVPDPTQENGDVSYNTGYGPNYELPQTDPDVKFIERNKMNAVLNDITTAIQEQQTNGIPDFITADKNGGQSYTYKKAAMVMYEVNGIRNVYQARQDNTSLPTVSSDWKLLDFGIESMPDATQSVKGVTRYATQAEANSRTSTTLAISPKTFVDTRASLTQIGTTQLNNTLTNTSTNLALTAAQGKVLQDSKLGINANAVGVVVTDSTANANYPVVWHNNSNKLFDTAAKFTFNPSTGRLTSTSFGGSLAGNSTTATTLQTARAFKIGNTSKNFNGSENLTWTASEIGIPTVIDNLTSTSSANALSANQGRILNEKIISQGLKRTQIYSSSSTSPQSTITLSSSVSNFDYVEVIGFDTHSEKDFILWDISSQLIDEQTAASGVLPIGIINPSSSWLTGTFNSEKTIFTRRSGQNYVIRKIYGVRVGI